MARTLSQAEEDIQLVADYMYLDTSIFCEWREAATIEYDMFEKVNKLLLKY